MTEAELRALVRSAVARHVSGRGSAPTDVRRSNLEVRTSTPSLEPQVLRAHASHYQYLTVVNVGESCVIEPSVECNHCGYCRSHGH